MILTRKMQAWIGVLTKVDRILSGTQVSVSFLGTGHAISMTDGKTVYIRADVALALTSESASDPIASLIKLKGLNYHELCHVIYTPRLNSPLVMTIQNARLLPYFNMLEDMRIETWFVAKYPPARRYLEAITLEWIANGDGAFELIYGRKFLTKTVKDAAFVDAKRRYTEVQLHELMDVIDAYIKVSPDADHNRTLDLVKKYAALVGLLTPKTPLDEEKRTESSAPSFGDSVKNAPKGLDKMLKAEDTADKSEDTADKSEDTADKSDPTFLARTASKELDDLQKDADVQSDLVESMSAVAAALRGDGIGSGLGENRTSRFDSPSPDSLTAYRKIHDLFRGIVQLADSEMQHALPVGRMDIRHLLSAGPADLNVFKAFDEGNEEATSVEMVILLDCSGSMSGSIGSAATVMWMLKHAFDQLGWSATVLGFSSNCFTIYQPKEKIGSRISIPYASGGTDPTDAMAEAEKLLLASRRPNKVLVTITDGAWGGISSFPQSLRGKVDGLLIGLKSAVRGHGKHGFEHAIDVHSNKELVDSIASLVARVVKRNAGLVV